MRALAALLVLSIGTGLGAALSAADFYPYGLPAGDVVLPTQDESASAEFQLVEPITFYGVPYRSLFVNQNGLVSFGTEVPYFRNQELSKFTYSLIAPFYADVDTYNPQHPDVGNGHIFYREERENGRLITGASKLISRSFKDAQGFVARSLFIATWDEVGHYESKADKRNSFQVVIASNETTSYAAFMYGALQWIVSDGGKDTKPDAPAQAGFVSDDGRHQTLVGSGTEDVAKLSELTNTQLPGLFLFRISGESPVDPRSTDPSLAGNGVEEEEEYDDYIDDDLDKDVVDPEPASGNSLELDDYYDYPDCPPNEHLFCPSSCAASTDANGCPLCECPEEAERQGTAYCSGERELYLECGSGCPLACDTLYDQPLACAEQCYAGCFCNESEGYVRQDSRRGAQSPCVLREQCPKPDLPAAPPAPDMDAGVSVVLPAEPQPELPEVMESSSGDSCSEPSKTYLECGSACPLGCDNLYNPPEMCTLNCVAGCFCKEAEGFVFHDARRWHESPCVRRDQCPQPEAPSTDAEAIAPAPPLYNVAGPGSASIDDLASVGVEEAGLARGTRQTCDTIQCHADAECRDQGGGACCHCGSGTYGNGKECLAEGEPQRINGRFSGQINGQQIPESDLHTYVVTSDGRAYTAVSQIPEAMGPGMVLLNTLGNIMGWLFAKTASPSVANGFMMTGGVFNRSVTVHIGDGHTVTIKQEFAGKDIFHYFKAKVFVSGTLPSLQMSPGGEFKIEYEDHVEEYRRVSPGVVKSYSTPVLTAGGRQYRLTIDQTIRYDECAFASLAPSTTSLRVERSYGLYDRNEQIVRFASANMASDGAGGADDPCRDGAHSCTGPRQIVRFASANMASDGAGGADDPCRDGAHSCTGPRQVCAPEGTSFRCLCTEGFEMAYPNNDPSSTGECVDLDECARGIAGCDANAECLNTQGSVVCQCRPGFRGTGHRCVAEGDAGAGSAGNCGGYVCADDAECLPATGGGMECVCRQGFYGNGVQCLPLPGTADSPQGAGAQPPPAQGEVGPPCTAHSDCSEYGICDWNEAIRQYQCRCRPPYSGDGIRCFREPASCDVARNCDPNADCTFVRDEAGGAYKCICRQGFSGDGLNCAALYPDGEGGESEVVVAGSPLDASAVCRGHAECGEGGACEWAEGVGQYLCACRQGWHGEPRSCRKAEHSGGVECNVLNNCHTDASCELTHTGTYACRCLRGFEGDGYACRPEMPGRPDSRPACTSQVPSDRGFEGDGYACRPEMPGRPDSRPACTSQEDCHENGHCVMLDGEADFACECLPGFVGDGRSYCDSADECSPGQEHGVCSPYATCSYLEARRAYVCQCSPGFEGDGRECRQPQPGMPQPPPPPPGQQPGYPAMETCDRRPDLCHRDAQCVLDYDVNRHVCQCVDGFQGDGEGSCERVEEDCSVRDDCHADADCLRDFNNNRHFCKCKYGFAGDGHLCTPTTTCQSQPEMCDAMAECVPEAFSYVCRCQTGYHGNGRQCTADSNLRGRSLVFAQGMSLVKRGLGPDEPGKQLVVVPFQIVVGIDFDCQEEKLFWTDVSGHAVRSSGADGGNVTVVLGEDIVDSPEGIALDWSSRNLYYADSAKDRIAVASMDGRHHLTLLSDGLVNPRAVAVDVANRRLYYSDWNRERPLIGRMFLDGTGREDFVTQDISLPNDLVVLHQRQELCWSDAGRQRLECVGLSGLGRRVVHAPLPYPFGVTVHEGETFFLTDWEDKAVHSVHVLGGQHRVMPASIGGSGKLYGITTLSEACPAGGTECGVENGGCPPTHICLPRGSQGNVCRCPDNLEDPESCTKMTLVR